MSQWSPSTWSMLASSPSSCPSPSPCGLHFCPRDWLDLYINRQNNVVLLIFRKEIDSKTMPFFSVLKKEGKGSKWCFTLFGTKMTSFELVLHFFYRKTRTYFRERSMGWVYILIRKMTSFCSCFFLTKTDITLFCCVYKKKKKGIQTMSFCPILYQNDIVLGHHKKEIVIMMMIQSLVTSIRA